MHCLCTPSRRSCLWVCSPKIFFVSCLVCLCSSVEADKASCKGHLWSGGPQKAPSAHLYTHAAQCSCSQSLGCSAASASMLKFSYSRSLSARSPQQMLRVCDTGPRGPKPLPGAPLSLCLLLPLLLPQPQQWLLYQMPPPPSSIPPDQLLPL